MELETLQHLIVDALDDIKGRDIDVIDTKPVTSLFDRVIVATGDSNRQVKALARNVQDKVREAGGEIISVEGEENGEWVLVDAGDIVVHVMQPAVRTYYNIEELWVTTPASRRTGADILAEAKAKATEAAAAGSAKPARKRSTKANKEAAAPDATA
jgi:ribosome-associated protein